MTPFDCLTEQELTAFTDYCKAYGGVGDYYDLTAKPAEPRHVLRFWNDAKQHLFETIFGGKLILEKEIELSKDPDDLYSDYENKVAGLIWPEDFRRFRREYKFGDYSYQFSSMLYTTCIVENKYNGSSFDVECPDGTTFKIVSGMKLMKIFKTLSEKFNLRGFEEYRLAHSMALNQKKIKGTLCLSIHPLDYLTLSDNEEDWSSCMSWREYGCFRQGTVEMMNSDKAIVAYVKSNNNTYSLKDLNWNSKKWRTLVVVDDKVMATVKGYPYYSTDLNAQVIEWLRELRPGYSEGAVWKINETRTIDGFKVRPHFITNVMYNDFGACDHYAAFAEHFDEDYDCIIDYSGQTECVCCGEALEWSHDGPFTMNLCCLDCHPYTLCRECENIVCVNDCDVYYDGEYYWCDSCRPDDRNYVEDVISGDHFDPDEDDGYRCVIIPSEYREKTSEERANSIDWNKAHWDSDNFVYRLTRTYTYTSWHNQETCECENYSTVDWFRIFNEDVNVIHEQTVGYHAYYFVYDDELTDYGFSHLTYWSNKNDWKKNFNEVYTSS